MNIGYSFWGFLGSGVVDTPDGGRSHRKTLVDGLCDPSRNAYDVVFLQEDRDLCDAGLDLSDQYRWDPHFPEIDVLFLEWRWPIPGRNTTRCGTRGHTCDLHRQTELVAHYSLGKGTPTILWDKDRKLPADHELRRHPAVTVCEPALHPSFGARTLLFPVSDASLDAADPFELSIRTRPTELVYVGNQYDRDEAFDRYLAPAAAQLNHRVAGKWPRTGQWSHVNFTGRCAFEEVAAIYGAALVTVLVLPRRYEVVGHMTQRIFEATLAGCLPLTPTAIRGADRFAPPELHVSSADEVIERTRGIAAMAGTLAHAELIARSLGPLDQFRASRQLAVLDGIITSVL